MFRECIFSGPLAHYRVNDRKTPIIFQMNWTK